MKAKDLLNQEVTVRRKNGDLYSPKCEVVVRLEYVQLNRTDQ